MSDKRQQIEQAATAAVQRGGLSNLSFRTLADDVGIKSSSVHYYFPEKSHLAAAVIDGYRQSFEARLDAIVQSTSTPAQALAGLADIFEDALTEDKFCLCGMLAAEVNTLSGDNRDALRGYFLMLQDWVLVRLADPAHSERPAKGTARAGLFGLSAEDAARIVLSGLEGALLLDRASGGQAHLNAHRRLIAQLVAGESDA